MFKWAPNVFDLFLLTASHTYISSSDYCVVLIEGQQTIRQLFTVSQRIHSDHPFDKSYPLLSALLKEILVFCLYEL